MDKLPGIGSTPIGAGDAFWKPEPRQVCPMSVARWGSRASQGRVLSKKYFIYLMNLLPWIENPITMEDKMQSGFWIKKYKTCTIFSSDWTCWQAINLLARGKQVVTIVHKFYLGKVRSRRIFIERWIESLKLLPPGKLADVGCLERSFREAKPPHIAYTGSIRRPRKENR